MNSVASSSHSRASRVALAGARVAGDEVTDHMDGWNPVDGVETGTVSLVGSGPGDPDLLTVAGLRELESADLVIADRLVSKEILGLVSFRELVYNIACGVSVVCTLPVCMSMRIYYAPCMTLQHHNCCRKLP